MLFFVGGFCFYLLASLPDSFEVRAANPNSTASIRAAQKLRGLDASGLKRFENWLRGMPESAKGVLNALPVKAKRQELKDGFDIDQKLLFKAVRLQNADMWLEKFKEFSSEKAMFLQRELLYFKARESARLGFIRRRAYALDAVAFQKVEDEIHKITSEEVEVFALKNIRIERTKKRIAFLIDEEKLGFLLIVHPRLGPTVVPLKVEDFSRSVESFVEDRQRPAQWRVMLEGAPLNKQLNCALAEIIMMPKEDIGEKSKDYFIAREDVFVDKNGYLQVRNKEELRKKEQVVVWASCGTSPFPVLIDGILTLSLRREAGFLDVLAFDNLDGLGFASNGERVADLLLGANAICGNGMIEIGEDCDDGNLIEDDLCSIDCEYIENGQSASWLKKQLLSSSALLHTVLLMFPALFFSVCASFLLAAFYVRFSSSKWALFIEKSSAFFSAMPSLVWALLLIFFFAVWLRRFPAQGIRSLSSSASTWLLFQDRIWHLILPWTCLAVLSCAHWFRILRPAWREAFRAPHCLAARAKGASEWRILFVHAGKPVLAVVFTLLSLAIPQWLGGALLVETLFGIPGVGRLLYTSILAGDLHTALIVVLFLACAASLSNVFFDGLQALIVQERALL